MKKLKKFISVVLTCAFAMTLFAGCSGSGNSDGGEDQMKIGISMSDMTHTTFIEMMDAIREEAKDKNVEIMEHSSDSDSGKLVEGLENFISAGCDAIIFQNFDPKAVESTIQDAKEKGIVVVAYDSYLEEADYVFEANNEDTGRAIGNMVGKWINENPDETVALVAAFQNKEEADVWTLYNASVFEITWSSYNEDNLNETIDFSYEVGNIDTKTKISDLVDDTYVKAAGYAK